MERSRHNINNQENKTCRGRGRAIEGGKAPTEPHKTSQNQSKPGTQPPQAARIHPGNESSWHFPRTDAQNPLMNVHECPQVSINIHINIHQCLH